MAIDDNASYELTGYQVKDLAQKIRAKADSASLASVATSGLYSDLTGAPTIPTVYNGTLTIQQNGTTLGTFSANQSVDVTVDLSDTTYSDFAGAASSTAGASGLVPAPAAGDQEKVLTGDGTWKDATAKLVEMSYGESGAWAKFIAAYNAGSIVYCRASSSSNPASGSQTRKAFMAYVNNAASPTEVEFQYVRSVSSKTDSQQSDQVFIYKLTNASGGTWTVTTRNMGTAVNVDSTLTKTYSGGANASVTLKAKTMTGATGSAAGTAGYVPAPTAGSQDKFLRGDGTWAAAGGGGRTTLYISGSLGVYSVGDTITLYKDKARTQPITTLAELGGLFDSSVVVIEDSSKESWLFFCWYDDDGYAWSGPGYFWVRSWGGEEYVLCWDRYDGNVLKLSSTTTYQEARAYSTSETYTGERWIDGKSIYRKTINFGALPNATTKSVAHGVSGLSEVVKIEGIAKSSSGNYASVPVVPGNANALCDCSVNATDVTMTAGSDRSGWSAYVTIYYTKS